MYLHQTGYLQLVIAAALAYAFIGVAAARTPPRGSSGGTRKHTTPPPRPAVDEPEYADDCPEPDGYFADGAQCDKYYECINGKIKEKLCPDGMVFNDYSIQVEKCDLPFNIDCSSRPALQEPKKTLHCPRLNGYFSHEDSSICDKFYYCVDGKYNMITCPAGLVYNEKTGICTWPDEAKKKGCSSQGNSTSVSTKLNQVNDLTKDKEPRRDKRLAFRRGNVTTSSTRNVKTFSKTSNYSPETKQSVDVNRRGDYRNRKVRRPPASEEDDDEDDDSVEDDDSDEDDDEDESYEEESHPIQPRQQTIYKKSPRSNYRAMPPPPPPPPRYYKPKKNGRTNHQDDSREDNSEERGIKKKKFNYDTIYGKTSYIWDTDDGWQPFGGDKSEEERSPPPPTDESSAEDSSYERTSDEKQKEYDELDGYIKSYIGQIHQDPSLNKFLDLKVYEKIAEDEYNKMEKDKKNKKTKKRGRSTNGSRKRNPSKTGSRTTSLTVRRVPKLHQPRPQRYFYDYQKPSRKYNGYKSVQVRLP